MLTDTQKSAIRLYLGYPDSYRYEHTRLESVLDNVSPTAEVQITALLTQLTELDTKIFVDGTVSAGVRRIDEIWLNTGTSPVFDSLSKTGRAFIGRLSTILGVPIQGDYYGRDGYPGDFFTWGGGTRGGPIQG